MKGKRLDLEEVREYVGEEKEAGRKSTQWATEGLRVAIERELTPRQRECVELYYFQGLTMEAIGRQLGIGKATVCRHLQKGEARLQRALAYMQLGRVLEKRSG